MWNPFEIFGKVKKAVTKGEEAILKGDAVAPASPVPQKGLIYRATVVQVVQPNNGVICNGCGEINGRIPGMCIWAAGIMSDLFGFKMNYVPPRGSKVLVLYTGDGINYIVGGYLGALHGDFQGQQRSVLGADDEDNGDSKPYGLSKIFAKNRKKFMTRGGAAPYNHGGNPAWDMVEGEVEITNALGVGATFLRHIAQLKAGDLAKVECMVIDDMVRIISQTFAHHSAFGDFKIYNDGGKLNVQWDGTNSDWEIHGKSEESEDPKIKQKDDAPGMLDPGKENSAKTAKWRFSHFVGFLGDFISTFISDPVVWSEGEEFLTQLQRSGKFRFHVNEDGTAIISTVNEFVIEKVCRIAVPLEQKREYDPEGNDPSVDLASSLKYIKTWNFEDSGGTQNIHYAIYQIREYNKWLSNQYTKAQFLRLDKDWKVPSEHDVPEPDVLGQEHLDKKEANADIEWPEGILNAYATIKIGKDGSITLLDSYDNAVVMTKAGIQLSSHNNVQIESAGSINMVAGRDINLVAKNSIDVTASEGGLSLRAETFIQNFCNSGGILLETNQSADVANLNEIVDHPNTDQFDESRTKGVVIKANNGFVRMESGRGVGIKSKGDTLITANGTCGMSAGRIQMNDTVEIFPKGAATMTVDPDQTFSPTTEEFLFDANNDGLGIVKVDGFLLGEKVLANFLMQYAEDLRPMLCPDEDKDGHLLGGDHVIANQQDVDNGDADEVGQFIGKEPPWCHPWHVISQNKKRFETTIEATTASEYKNTINNAKFIHRDKTEYGTTGATTGEAPTALYQTLTQQSLILDLQNTHLNKIEYDNDLWFYGASGASSRGAPWPGTGSQLGFITQKKLWEPDTTDPKDYINKATGMSSVPIYMKVVK